MGIFVNDFLFQITCVLLELTLEIVWQNVNTVLCTLLVSNAWAGYVVLVRLFDAISFHLLSLRDNAASLVGALFVHSVKVVNVVDVSVNDRFVVDFDVLVALLGAMCLVFVR